MCINHPTRDRQNKKRYQNSIQMTEKYEEKTDSRSLQHEKRSPSTGVRVCLSRPDTVSLILYTSMFRCFWSFLSLVFSGISMAFSRMSPGFPGISRGFLWSSLVFCPNADRSAVSPVKSRQALNCGLFWEKSLWEFLPISSSATASPQWLIYETISCGSSSHVGLSQLFPIRLLWKVCHARAPFCGFFREDRE